ncbi:hypothetical protein Zmor_010602 [Zophobas morio]|uniref:Uncharacterized protein n=1 Tax=Zophobas morio TaxID=2755281 RepID=A0AA38IRJ7_9CUCU|nr:hypothetical protein Zmor_010602 [Zophobas morio]
MRNASAGGRYAVRGECLPDSDSDLTLTARQVSERVNLCRVRKKQKTRGWLHCSEIRRLSQARHFKARPTPNLHQHQPFLLPPALIAIKNRIYRKSLVERNDL